MSEIKDFAPGTFCWVDLATTDQEAAKKFYGSLFGWTFQEAPVGEDMTYSMAEKNGKSPCSAIYTMPDEVKSQGIPSHWLSYVLVTNTDEATKKAKSLGATIFKEPFDVFTAGRMSVIGDPAGAAVALWQPIDPKAAASIVNEPGSLTWNELLTNNVDKAGKFYTELFGWGSQTQDTGGGAYTMFTNGERPAGGMMAIAKEWGEVPPNWLVYFAVADCDKTTKQAEGLGAKVVSPPMDIPEIGRFAALQDPQGATFAVIKLENPL